MAIKMEGEYKGHVIVWSDWGKYFSISLDGTVIKGEVPTTEDCEKWIDARLKKKYRRVSGFARVGYGSGIREGEATSAVDGEEVWFVTKSGGKGKVRAKDVWLNTPENLCRLHDIASKKEKISALENEIKIITESADFLSVSMMEEE